MPGFGHLIHCAIDGINADNIAFVISNNVITVAFYGIMEYNMQYALLTGGLQ